MNELYDKMLKDLDALDKILDEEWECLIHLKHEDLLRLITRKRSIHAEIAASLSRIASQVQVEHLTLRESIKGRAREVQSKGTRNERLAQMSIRIVDSLRGLILRHNPASGRYDRTGQTVRPSVTSGFSESV
jgi:flagellar biosynthesis/type III secretory pathway chaperone